MTMTPRQIMTNHLRAKGRSDERIERSILACVRSSQLFQEKIDMEMDESSAVMLREMLDEVGQLPPNVVKAMALEMWEEENSKN